MRLLLVEDDDHVAAALSAILAKHGFTVTHARNGEEALQAVLPTAQGDRPSYGVILLDLGLPDQDGYQVCGRIRKLTTTPVIMVTARGDVRSRIHGLNLGADDYVVKPYDPGELLARIHAVSRRRAGAEETPGPRAPSTAPCCGSAPSPSSCPPAGSASKAPASRSPARSSTSSPSSRSGPASSSAASRSSARSGTPVGRGPAAPWRCTSPPCAPSCGCPP